MTTFLVPRQDISNQGGSAPPMSGPPYAPTTAALGGRPTVSLDVPICAVFLFLFILGAISHMTIYLVNRKRGHRFLISGMLFGFCMARNVTMIMRIVWAFRPRNTKIAIAANVFTAAGVVLLFIINLLFAQRIVRACHPNVGWSKPFHWAFISIYVLIGFTLVILITSVIQSFYTLNSNTKRIDRDLLLYGQTFYAVVAFLPIPLVIAGLIIPRKTRVEKFGHGRFRTKIGFLLGSSFLLALAACYRVGTNYAGGTRSARNPAPYQSKAPFYIFNFAIEIVVILGYVIIRVDKRFYVPNHSKKAGDYSRGPDFYTRREQGIMDKERTEAGTESVIAPEEEVFDETSSKDVADRDAMKDREGMKNDSVDEERGIPLEPIAKQAAAVQASRPSMPGGFPTTGTARMPPTPSATPPVNNERLAFPGEPIPTSRV